MDAAPAGLNRRLFVVAVAMAIMFVAGYFSGHVENKPTVSAATERSHFDGFSNPHVNRDIAAVHSPAAFRRSSGGEVNAQTQALVETLSAISDMPTADLFPPDSAPKHVRLRAGEAVCLISAMSMPHICGTQRRADLLEACARHWGADALERALPERCRASIFWTDIVKPVFARSSVKEAALGPLSDPFATARYSLISEFCKRASCDKREPPIGRDYVIRASVTYAGSEVAYTVPGERTFLKNLPFKTCTGSSNFAVYPINFGIVEELIVPQPYHNRIWDFMPVHHLTEWRKWAPYILREHDELLLHETYRRSFFGFTHRRVGWDCFRHYEILAAGSLPYFADLAMCDPVCLAALPKKLLEQAMNLPGVSHIGRVRGPHRYSDGALTQANEEYLIVGSEVKKPTNVNFRKLPSIDWTLFNRSQYDALVVQTLEYTRKYLTTKSVVSYLLHRIQYEEPQHVLLFTRDSSDYMEMTIEHGLAELGIRYYTAGEYKHKYKQRRGQHDPEPSSAAMDHFRSHDARLQNFPASATGFGLRVQPLPRDRILSASNIRERLERKEFDLVIYSYLQLPTERLPFYDDVVKHVPKDKIVVVCGNDNRNGEDGKAEMRAVDQFAGHFFRRELEDVTC